MTGAPIDDRLARAIGIPMFGVIIPLATGLYGPSPWPGARVAAGQVVFLALAAAIWHGNRYLLFSTAERFDWLTRPLWRLGRLLAGIVLFTAPLTWLTLVLWYRWGLEAEPDRDVLLIVTLANVICVIFVAHGYETVLLIKGRAESLVREERLERARAESELLSLRRQVDPHFLFNCLNTLQQLIVEDKASALAFNQDMAAMLRYLLASSDRSLVTLAEELDFVRRYAALLGHRFGAALRVHIELQGVDAHHVRLPPTAIQLLVENAVKHNRFTSADPLVVDVHATPAGVTVTNPARPRSDSGGAGLGLGNLSERVRLIGAAPLRVERTGSDFVVFVPVVS